MYNRYLRLRGCPRCGGTLLYERAYEEVDEVCLQCGFRKYGAAAPEKRTRNEPAKASPADRILPTEKVEA